MNFISKNIKKAGIFNLIITIVAMGLLVKDLLSGIDTPADVCTSLSLLLALAFGIVYMFYGYKKEGSRYYKIFMALFFFSLFIDVFDEFAYFDNPEFNSSMFSTYACFIRLILLFPLAFFKNFGKRNSTICSFVIHYLSLFIFIRSIILYSQDIQYVYSSLGQLVISMITIIFVNEKYADKTLRGTE